MRGTKQKTPAGSFVELVVIVAVALGLALGIQAFLVKPYRIPSGSMEPTLDINQRVLVNRIGNNFTDPEVGDVMVFHPPRGATGGPQNCGVVDVPPGQLCPRPTDERDDVNFIKRVVGEPGDTIRVVDGRVIRNGRPADEPYANLKFCDGGDNCTFQGSITVPPDHYFMMGDNRGASDDSRFWGPVPRDWFIGGAFATYWPPKKIGPL
ncbi:MAG TPA: signal peptidase I [Solirubrobacteraceae bacterium]|nr:signal peptidase I [Solirubrobacteraceae bacterium]